MEEVLAAGDHDHVHLARRGPAERIGERHGLVEVAVDHDACSRCVWRPGSPNCGSAGSSALPMPSPVMRRKPGATSTSRANSARRLARVATAPPNEKPASHSGRLGRSRARVLDHAQHVVGLAAALVVRAFGRAHAAEVEAHVAAPGSRERRWRAW